MATYSEVYAQLTGTDFIVYSAVCHDDPFKREICYKNLNGLTGTLSALACHCLGVTEEDLPKIVSASDLACAIKDSSNNSFVWKTIDIAANGGIVASTGSDRALEFKGSVPSSADLPMEGNSVGDVYQVANENYTEYVWIEKEGEGCCWDILGGGGSGIDTSIYYTKTEIDAKFNSISNAGLDQHIADTNVHVTSDEKASWNAKAEESDIEAAVGNEATVRSAAIKNLDDSINFGKLINRIWIYGNGVYDLNLMVEPGMYYCSKDANVVGQSMLNIPEGASEGCLLVLKNSQIFWEGGSKKGRTFYRYQTGAGPVVTEYTEEWTASAQLADLELVRADIDSLQAEIDALKSGNGTSDAKIPNIQFIEGGTVQAPVTIDLAAGTWYVAITPFTGSLPEAPSNGTIIQVSYEHGQENMKVIPSGSDTINGAAAPCLIGISGDGTFVDNESHRFVYHSGNWILL